ncbi:FAD-binding and (Fe-S)-binding domain-containing protein [Thauera linaloolentis]|uniref:D-lactate dehydrogenase (cytochrome) n=1 Tax=Thauera linaloolentis (strain DSM 12138 / JCM 21573 / CCUG 41526 / CIP 105981 / IAM 15112 / NBRC 102519 / 47Lol) TaxID=1123367 RepID=N6Z2D0_THAL4|nr:FAD-binding and (Fe-S)-binding domain-containing protein [Thauera linaloolentis]ENO88767.1 iron-sulfur binding oxidase [Thauera linaloolentis 47Lol = DSM 12138]MCM8564924.1 FAD-binding oxidoreductase [Thauera linaloolentis]
MSALIEALRRRLPAERVITDELRRLAYGTDGSFYRLIPEVVAVVDDEDEVRDVIALARSHQRPVTFRAAGTSLCGQAVTDGVLVLLGEGLATCRIAADGATVEVGPAIIGAEVNRRLAPLGCKIGPDPASINAAKIGGIAANNSSGMCCGTAQNSYNTLAAIRVLLADGSLLDTADAASVAAFRSSHAALLGRLAALSAGIKADEALCARIRSKYKIKNTTGYSLNALVDFDDPVDILAHLMIGSEGTLGFISRVTYRTVPEYAHKASALVFFPDMDSACRAVAGLKSAPVDAVELLDRASLRAVADKPGMPPLLRELADGATALLIETRGPSAAALSERMAAVLAELARHPLIEAPAFTTDAAEIDRMWNVRKGTFPAVGAVRKPGTTVIIEDIAVAVPDLAACCLDLQHLFARHGYHEAIIFGHALEGNVHFVFTQDFGIESEVARYAAFMDELCTLLVDKYDGSLKAEHGTGRNMAPFVELEWGAQAYALMKEIKRLFDPEELLNPGVIINDDAQAHLKHLKPMPAAGELYAPVDRCIECGFCEPQCPSHGLTLSPRQRIVGWRELSRRKAAGEAPGELGHDYLYMGLDTCATCGLCSTACPVGIETGALTRAVRGENLSSVARMLGRVAANNFGATQALARGALKAGHLAESVLGTPLLARLTGGAWKAGMPRPQPAGRATPAATGDKVVYFPTCAGRMFGADTPEHALSATVIRVLERAGYAPFVPDGIDALCCGQSFASRGLAAEADGKSAELEAVLRHASEDGRYPIVLDASACSLRMKAFLGERLPVYDLVEFAHDALLPRLMLAKKTEPVLIHLNCSARRMDFERKLTQLARACAEQVTLPAEVKCCGFGGDRGFVVPELNAHALRKLAADIPAGCCGGYSSNQTCEIGLTAATGLPYRSIVHLLDECSREAMRQASC